MRYRWLLFDADNTLFDYDKAEIKALSSTLQSMNHRFEPRYIEVYRQINGQMWLDFEQGKLSQDRLKVKRFELLLETISIEIDPVTVSNRYLRNLSESSDLILSAEETVKALCGKIGLVVITNGLKEVQRPRLARSAISDCFTDIVISEEVGASKPDRRIFDTAFSRMGYPSKDSVLIIGDSLTSDIKGGNDYGIDTCWFNRKRFRNLDVDIQYEISQIGELLDIVHIV